MFFSKSKTFLHLILYEIIIGRRFNHLKPNVILDRLVFRKQYGLAIQIAKHLKLPESRILEHWAFHKVTYDKSRSNPLHTRVLIVIKIYVGLEHSTDDDDVARKISDKVKSSGAQGISFCNIAKKAQKEGRNNLAIKVFNIIVRIILPLRKRP